MPISDIKIQRIDLGEGRWWDIYTQRPYGALRAIRRELDSVGGDADLTKIPRSVADNINIAMIVGCTADWSWDEPVDEAHLALRTEGIVDIILKEMTAMYRETVEDDAELKKE